MAAAPALAGIDGVNGSGKTTLADVLVPLVARPLDRVRVDDFLRPAEQRYQFGRRSPIGCSRDTFDHEALRARLSTVDRLTIVDGVFLLRPELDVAWDLGVHLQVPDARSCAGSSCATPARPRT